MGFFSKELKNEFETAVVNYPSVFEPLKFYCMCIENSNQRTYDHKAALSRCDIIMTSFTCWVNTPTLILENNAIPLFGQLKDAARYNVY